MIAETLALYAKATVRTFEGRENSVGASEIGQCARKVFFAKNAGDHVYGVASDEDWVDTWGAALRGRLIEDHFWVPALRARFGDKLKFAGGEQTTFISEFLSATPDGLLIEQPADALTPLGVSDIGGDHSLVVESKTIDPRTRLDGPKPEHVFQAQVQLGLIRQLTPYRPKFALVSYINASFLDDVVEFVVPFDPAIFDVADRRAAQIMVARSADELKPEGWIAGGRECEFCPYTGACGSFVMQCQRRRLLNRSINNLSPKFASSRSRPRSAALLPKRRRPHSAKSSMKSKNGCALRACATSSAMAAA